MAKTITVCKFKLHFTLSTYINKHCQNTKTLVLLLFFFVNVSIPRLFSLWFFVFVTDEIVVIDIRSKDCFALKIKVTLRAENVKIHQLYFFYVANTDKLFFTVINIHVENK